jgi:hypothetical protein
MCKSSHWVGIGEKVVANKVSRSPLNLDGNKGSQRAIVLLVLASVLVYANSFSNEFVWDDKEFIVNNLEIRQLGNIPNFFNSDVAGVYRPIRTVFYSVNYSLWGLNPKGYHLFALLVHGLNTLLVYGIAREILKNKRTSLLAGLFFAAHPIHTESITFMTTSFDEVGAVFFLAAFYLYLRSKEAGVKKEFYWGSVIFFILAIFTYEVTLTLPLVIAAYDYALIKRNFQ